MTDHNRIAVTSRSPTEFDVEVREEKLVTTHAVTIPDGFLARVGLANADAALVVRESFGFLLEQEPASSILRAFSLDVIARYFPEYYDELRARIKG